MSKVRVVLIAALLKGILVSGFAGCLRITPGTPQLHLNILTRENFSPSYTASVRVHKSEGPVMRRVFLS